MKAAGNGPKTICSGFSADKKKQEYCEQKIEEQCMNPVKQWCEELHPKKDGDAYKKCAAEANTSWEKPQDEALKKALESRAKKFSVDFRDHDSVRRQFSVSNLQGCASIVKDIVHNYGAPRPPESQPGPKDATPPEPTIIEPPLMGPPMLPPSRAAGKPLGKGQGHVAQRPSPPRDILPPIVPPVVKADASPSPEAKADPFAEARAKIEANKKRLQQARKDHFAEARARIEANKRRLAEVKARVQKAQESLREAKRRAAEGRREEVKQPEPPTEQPKGPVLPPIIPPVVPQPTTLPEKPQPDVQQPPVSAEELVKIKIVEAKRAREELALARKRLAEAEKAEALARKEAKKLGKVKARLAKVERVEEKKEPEAGKAVDTSAREEMMKRESAREERQAQAALARELKVKKEEERKAAAKAERARKEEERKAKAQAAREAKAQAASEAKEAEAAKKAEAAEKQKAPAGTKVAVVTGIERPSVTPTVPTPEIAPVTLTPENFNNVIIYSRQPVIIAVVDQLHSRSVDIIQGLIKEQKDEKDPSRKAAIAILDIGNKNTRQPLWESLVNLRREFGPVMINKNQIKPSAIFLYEKRILKNYVTSHGIESAILREPPIPRLTMEFYREKLKYRSLRYPLAVYVVRDPADANFVGVSRKDTREKFYINWSDRDDRAFATQVLGIPPLSDDQAYVVYESQEPDKYGFLDNLKISSPKNDIVPNTVDALIDNSTLNEDPFEFIYLDNNDYSRYFGDKDFEDAIVVVGDPINAGTQKIIQRIVDEKRQLSLNKRLFVVPYTKNYKASEIIERLGIPVRKNTKLPQVFEVKRSEGGSPVIRPFKPRGFERVHAGNNLWQEVDKKDTQDVLVVIGDDNTKTNKAVAEATHKVQKHLIERSGTITPSGRKRVVKRMVFVNYGEAQRLLKWGGIIEFALNQNAGKGYPQVYLTSGQGKRREGEEISAAEMGMSGDFGAAPMQFGTEIYKPGASVATPTDIENLRREAALKEKGGVAHVFTETKIGNRRWDTSTRFVIVIGRKDDPKVEKAKVAVVRKEMADQENRSLFFLDTTTPVQLPFRERAAHAHALLTELVKIGVPNYISGGIAVFSCGRDSLRKAPECKPYPLTNGK